MPEIGHHPHAVDGHPGVVRQVLEEAPVGGGELFAWSARSEQQLSDYLTLIGERDVEGVVDGLAGGRGDLEPPVARKSYGRVAELERLSDRSDDGREHGVGSECGFQALAEARDHPVGIVAFAVHQVVYRTLQAGSQGGEEHGDYAGSEQGDRQVALGSKNRAEVADDQYVDAGDSSTQGAVHQGAVDYEVYVVESVAQHRYAHGDRDGEDSETQYAPVFVQRRKHGGYAGERYDAGEGEPLDLLALYAGRAAEACCEGHHGGESAHADNREPDETDLDHEPLLRLCRFRGTEGLQRGPGGFDLLLGAESLQASLGPRTHGEGDYRECQAAGGYPGQPAPAGRGQLPVGEEQDQESRDQGQTRYPGPGFEPDHLRASRQRARACEQSVAAVLTGENVE